MKSRLFRKSYFDRMLSQKPLIGRHQLEPLRSLFVAGQTPIGLMEDCRVSKSELEAEIHKEESDLWICLQGRVWFTCGGTLIGKFIRKNSNGKEVGGKGIRGGQSFWLKPGDVLFIPAGEPHLHTTPSAARLFIIKIPNNRRR